jgi:hypothetical protein
VTRRPWHVTDAAEFARIRPLLEAEYPYLHLITRDGDTVLAGDFPLVLEGRVVDSFQIEIAVPPAGPRAAVPIVREVGGRIPYIADRHMYRDGTACLFVEAEFWFKHPTGMDLIDFLRGPITSYFIAQFSYEQGKGWPFGERAHGAQGIIDFYAPIFGTRNVRIIRRFVGMIAAKKLRSTWHCPCGSDRQLGSCHGGLLRSLRERIKRSAALSSLSHLERDLGPTTRRAS